LKMSEKTKKTAVSNQPEKANTPPRGADVPHVWSEIEWLNEDRKVRVGRIIKKCRDKINKLRKLVYLDELTQVPNRRHFDETLQREVADAERHGPPLSLIFLDVDHFKQYNDTLGHEEGDEALKAVATSIKNSLRKGDFVARYGGEEFVVVLPNTDINGAAEAAEKIRKAVEGDTKKSLEHSVTISGGYAQYDKNNVALNSAKTLRESADQALYQSKESGRNRMTAFKSGLPMIRHKEKHEKTAEDYYKELPKDPEKKLEVLRRMMKMAEAEAEAPKKAAEAGQ